MTIAETAAVVAAATAGWLAAVVTLRPAIERAPGSLVRHNVNGALVPATGGLCLAAGATAGALVGLGLVQASLHTRSGNAALSAAFAGVIMLLAGWWDDARGDERPRGFKGHFRAVAGGRLTGGIVKIAAGLVAGVGAGLLVAHGREAAEVALLVALMANLVNLFDRAPGRAGKLSLVLLLVLAPVTPLGWVVAAGGLLGGLAAVLPADLGERIMLGDAGANALGAVAGLGLGLALPEQGRIAALVVLVGLTAASERWSFSRAIEANRFLRALDRAGRKRREPADMTEQNP